MYVSYIVMLVVCALGISALSLWLGRMLRPGQDNPHRAVAAVPAPRAEVPESVETTGSVPAAV